MPIVDFDTKIWTDPWFKKLTIPEKLLFIYLWTNDHKNLACLYPLAIDTMSFETRLDAKEIETLLSCLLPKVKYDEDAEIVWVVNYVKHQFMKKSDRVSPTVLVKLVKDLRTSAEDHPFLEEFFQKYPHLQIEYLDTVSGYCIGKGKGTGKGKDKGKGTGKGKEQEEDSFQEEEREYPTECISPSWEEIGKGAR